VSPISELASKNTGTAHPPDSERSGLAFPGSSPPHKLITISNFGLLPNIHSSQMGQKPPTEEKIAGCEQRGEPAVMAEESLDPTVYFHFLY
jgi:hypothetical protein